MADSQYDVMTPAKSKDVNRIPFSNIEVVNMLRWPIRSELIFPKLAYNSETDRVQLSIRDIGNYTFYREDIDQILIDCCNSSISVDKHPKIIDSIGEILRMSSLTHGLCVVGQPLYLNHGMGILEGLTSVVGTFSAITLLAYKNSEWMDISIEGIHFFARHPASLRAKYYTKESSMAFPVKISQETLTLSLPMAFTAITIVEKVSKAELENAIYYQNYSSSSGKASITHRLNAVDTTDDKECNVESGKKDLSSRFRGLDLE